MASLPKAIFGHTATAFAPGKALVAGGATGSTAYSDAAIYDYPFRPIGQSCPVASECLSGFCNQNCCAAACTGACKTCDAAGACLAVTDADDPDSCTGVNTCDASGVCTKRLGHACALHSECASGHCVDGFCCDGACGGACQVCAAAKGASADGVCGNALADTNPRGACSKDAAYPSSCKGDGTCDGKGACRAVTKAGTSCGEPRCDGTRTSSFACDGSGTCAATTTSDCAPFGCRSGACFAVCASDADCATGFACGDDGKCAVNGGRSCVDDHTARGASGASRDCAPFKCQDGRCLSTCAQPSDCLAPYECNADHACVAPAAPADTGGCAIDVRPRAAGLTEASMLLAAVLAARRARRSRRGDRRGA